MFDSLIANFLKVQHKPLMPTYLELAGYPHYENVISNLLAFFLLPTAQHQLKDLVLSSLLKRLGIEQTLSNVRIEREVQTEYGRIDLLLSSDTHVMLIENKIYHHAEGNPFSDYVSYVTRAFPDKIHCLIVLTPFPSSLNNQRRHLDELGFNVVSYQDFFGLIRSFMGEYAADSSVKYWLLLLDVIQSIENLTKGTSMESTMLQFFQEHSDSLSALLKEVAQLRSEMRNKVVALNTKMADSQLLVNCEVRSSGAYYREQDRMFDTLYFDFTFFNGAKVGCDIIVRLSGWEIKVHPRNPSNRTLVTDMLAAINIPFQEVESRFLLTNQGPPMEFTTDISDMATVASGVLNKLSAEAIKSSMVLVTE